MQAQEAYQSTFQGLPLLAVKPKTQNTTTSTLVWACVDYRYWPHVVAFVKETLQIPEFDLKLAAGAAKEINSGHSRVKDWMIDTLELLQMKHGVEQVLIFKHFGCAAYGGNTAFDGHAHQLQQLIAEIKTAAKAITKLLNIKVGGYIVVDLDDGAKIGIVSAES